MHKKIYEYIDKNIDQIKAFGSELYLTPELGFKEHKTQVFIENVLNNHGIPYETFADCTGVKVVLASGKKGPSVGLVAELDAVMCPQHIDSLASGAVHACGHNIMVADVLGVLLAFHQMKMMDELCGQVEFLFVPAEEYLEMNFRQSQINLGHLKYPTGKAEMLHRGMFDSVDVCVMIHAVQHEQKICLEGGSNGFIAKKATFIGQASHAASGPENGVNALYAANIALNAINSIRETFVDQGQIRVHPVISKASDAVNVIPSEVEMEMFIRANNMSYIKDTNNKVNRALVSGALALGADIIIENTPGMLPLQMTNRLTQLGETVGQMIVDKNDVVHLKPSSGSTDLGDISCLIPAIETCIGCIEGGLHSPNYRVVDEDTAYGVASKYLAGMALSLLDNNGENAYAIIDEHEPVFESKEVYFEYLDEMFESTKYQTKDWLMGGKHEAN